MTHTTGTDEKREKKVVDGLVFYRKLSSYGHSQLVVSIPKELSEYLDKKVIYKVTLESISK